MIAVLTATEVVGRTTHAMAAQGVAWNDASSRHARNVATPVVVIGEAVAAVARMML